MKKQSGKKLKWMGVTAAVLMAAGSPALNAASYTWGFDADGNWTDSSGSAGWNAAGAFPNAVDDVANLTFNITAARQVTVDANVTIGTLNLNDTGSGTDSAWTVSGTNTLTFDVSSGNAVLTSAGATNLITAPITLNDTLDLTATNAITIGNSSVAGVIGGTGGLNKSGSNILTLGGTSANTYSGTTTVSAGTLTLAKSTGVNAIAGDLTITGGSVGLTNNNQIADTSTVTVSGGTFSMADKTETIANLNVSSGSVTFTTGATGGLTVSTATNLSGGSVSISTGTNKTISFGALTMSGGVISHSTSNTSGTALLSASSVDITNIASGAYTPITLSARGTGTVVQTASFTLSGDLTVHRDLANSNANSVTIDYTAVGGGVPSFNLSSGSHTFTIEDGQAANDFVIRTRVGGSGDLVKAGAGTMLLDGPNSYTGSTKVVAGTLAIGSYAASTTTSGVGYSANSTTDTFTVSGSSFQNGDQVLFTGGTIPTGASQNTPYYVINASGTSFQISTTQGGSAVDITDAGSGTKLATQLSSLGATNSAVVLGDAALSAPTDSIALISTGAFENRRDISVVNAGASTTIGATNASSTTATYSGAIALGKNVNLSSQNSGATTEFSGVIDDSTGSFAVTTTGSGTIKLSSATGNTYDGGTTVGSGSTLLVSNASGSATGSGAVAVGGTLKGNGSLSGAVNVAAGGVVAPGASIGTLTTGDMTLASAATLSLELNTTTLTADLLNVGAFNLASSAGSLLQLSLVADSAIGLGQVFTLVDYGTWNGELFTYNSGVLADGDIFTLGLNTYQIDYNNGTSLTLTTVAVPEPSSLFLVAAGAGTLWVLRRRKSRA